MPDFHLRRRLRRRAEPEPGEPDRGRRHAVAPVAVRDGDWREQHGKAGGPGTKDSTVVRGLFTNVGAYIMGRKMFGGGDGPWNESWTGWWGDDPPYHAPVFVLTHHPRDPLPMQGGTTFHFVTDGIETALEQARAAAGDKDVEIAGGASAVQQYLAAGLL